MLDIIIPQYSEDEGVLKNLLDSIKNQKGINFDEIKITIVNDCSDVILSDAFLNSYTNLSIKYLRNIRNTGPGLARQYGVDNTNEEYITFIDSDDELSSDTSLMKVIEFLKHNRPNYLVTNIVTEVILDDKLTTIIKKRRNTMPWMHGKFYKREFLNENNIRFHENIRHTEDSYYTTCVLGSIKPDELVFLDTYTVLWKMNKNSITRKYDVSDYTFNTFEYVFNTPVYAYDFLVAHNSYLRFSYYVSSMFGLYMLLNSNVFNKKDRITQKNDYENKLKNNIIRRRNIFILFKENQLLDLWNNELEDLKCRLNLKEMSKTLDDFTKEMF